MDELDTRQYNEPIEKKKRNKNVKKIKDLEKEILQQTLVIKHAQEYYSELVDQYNQLKN